MCVLKEAAVDILVTLFILVSVAMQLTWGRWVILVYVVLMLVLKLVALFSTGVRNLTTQQRRGATPNLVYHVLYAINTLAVAVGSWWELAAGWVAIWIVSVLVDRQR